MTLTQSPRDPPPRLDTLNNTAFFYGTLMAPSVLLDIFEGAQYERRGVKPKEQQKEKSGQEVGPEEVDAQTYIWIDDPSALEPDEWDFEAFKQDKMYAWMGLAPEDANGVDMDEGFKQVDEAHAAAGGSVNPNGGPKDGMGGRGVNGHIGRELAETHIKNHQSFASNTEQAS
ncbi:hypothetical protein DV738_g3112, partial [Chaetothyriales sp. CBS 135597]